MLSERTHLFVAEDLTPGAMRPEADEQMQPQVVPDLLGDLALPGGNSSAVPNADLDSGVAGGARCAS